MRLDYNRLKKINRYHQHEAPFEGDAWNSTTWYLSASYCYTKIYYPWTLRNRETLTVQELLERNLRRWVVSSKQHCSVIESSAFQQFFKIYQEFHFYLPLVTHLESVLWKTLTQKVSNWKKSLQQCAKQSPCLLMYGPARITFQSSDLLAIISQKNDNDSKSRCLKIIQVYKCGRIETPTIARCVAHLDVTKWHCQYPVRVIHFLYIHCAWENISSNNNNHIHSPKLAMEYIQCKDFKLYFDYFEARWQVAQHCRQVC